MRKFVRDSESHQSNGIFQISISEECWYVEQFCYSTLARAIGRQKDFGRVLAATRYVEGL